MSNQIATCQLKKVKSAIIDGEVIVPAADGKSDFAVLQKELRGRRPSDKLVM